MVWRNLLHKAHYAETSQNIFWIFYRTSIETQTTEETTQTTEETTQTTEDIAIDPVKENIEEKNALQNEKINEKQKLKQKLFKRNSNKNNSENILENEDHDNLSVEDIELENY